MSTTYKQILRAKAELETSLINARELRNQWLSAMDFSSQTKSANTNTTTNDETTPKQTGSKKELDQSTKALKNKLLAVKWDFEDLEELLSVYKHDNTQSLDIDEVKTVEDIRRNIGDWRNEISQMMSQIEDAESSSKLFQKHGIAFHNPISAMKDSNGNKYERLTSASTTTTNDPYELDRQQQHQQQQQQDMDDVVQFDKSLVSPNSGGQAASIVNNLLYDHLEDHNNNNNRSNGFSPVMDPSQVFNNLSRPVTTNVYMNPNENEMILDMLETEYYQPPDGLLQDQANNHQNNSTRIDTMFKKLFDTNRNKFLTTIIFLCSFPTLLILFMIA